MQLHKKETWGSFFLPSFRGNYYILPAMFIFFTLKN